MQKKANAYIHEPEFRVESRETKKAATTVKKTRDFFVELFISVIAPINGAENNTRVLQSANAQDLYTVACAISIPLSMAQY